jgi:TonB family protein
MKGGNQKQIEFKQNNYSLLKLKIMKKFIVSLLCMTSLVFTFGQNQKQNQKMMEEISCTPPKFTGIKNANIMLAEEKIPTIENYLGKNVHYPESSIQRMEQGTEVVRFVVTPQGEVADINIINSVSTEIDDVVIRALIATKGMWKPGQNNEKPVTMEKEVSVVFRIDELGCDSKHLGKKYFLKGGEMLFTKQSPKKALKYLNKGIILLPNEPGMLALRGLTRYELGDRDGALSDWSRINTLGGLEGDGYIDKLIEMKGYAEMTQVLEK